MGINSLEIKDKTNCDLDNISYIDDSDVNSLRITKKESRLVLIFIILDVLLTKMMIL